MYHHHHTRLQRRVHTQHSVFPHLNLPCIHSLQLTILAFCTLHPFLPCTRGRCMSISLTCRMFSPSCTVGVPCPRSPRSLQLLLRIDRNLSSVSPRPNTLLVVVTLIIRSHSFLLLQFDISLPLTTHVELLPPIPSSLESTTQLPSFS